jgi:hypothetical protein
MHLLRGFLLLCVVTVVVLFGTNAVMAKEFGGNDVEKNIEIVSSSADTIPDAWGYTWRRSTDPGGPVFNWVDISQIGTQVTGIGDDANVGPFPIGFSFPYYWYTTNTFRIGSNGYIVLRNDGANWSSPFPAIPTTSPAVPKDVVAALVGDLDPSQLASNPRIYYWSNLVDSLVLSFIDVAEWRSPADPNTRHTFQIILNKQDSSIVFQYGRQQGRYNASNNNRLLIGWQNQSGQIGQVYTNTTYPPEHPLMPDSGLAIRIKRTVNTGLQVTDAGILGGFNLENLAKIVRVGVPDTIKAIVKNFGTVNLTNVRVTYSITRAGQPTALDTVFIASMVASAETTITFPRLFTPAVTGSYSATFTTFVSGDQGPLNNTRVAELVSASFVAGQRTLVAYETNTLGGSIGWTGGGGFGVHYELPVSVVVDSVYFRATTAASVVVEVLEDAGGFPGGVRATRTVTSVANALTGVSFAADSASLNFPNGKFFIGARGQVSFSYELVTPISFRTWEYTNGYAPYRSRDVQDIIMRATVRTTGGGVPAISVNPTSITRTLNQGDSVDVPIRIRNVGTGTLTWSASSSTLALTPIGNSDELQRQPVSDYRYERTPRVNSNVVYPEVTYGPELDGILTDINESFEGATFPPAGWIKLNPDGGPGWNRQLSGTTPIPGWNGGRITVPSGGGNAVAFCTWTTGGSTSNDQWLVTPQITNIGAGDSLKFWLRYWPNSYADTLEVRISTTTPTVGNFNVLVATLGFPAAATTDTNWNQYRYRLASFVPTGSNIYIGFRERVADNLNDGASFSLDLVQVTQGAAPVEWLRLVGATSGSIAPGDSATLTARLYGRTALAFLSDTTFNGNIQITSNDPSNPTVNVPVTLSVVTGVGSDGDGLPETFVLQQNYPNPFNPSTEIQYALPKLSFVTIKVYSLLGQEIVTLVNGDQTAGYHVASWDGRNLNGASVGSGMYFYRMEARTADGASFVNVKKMLLLK